MKEWTILEQTGLLMLVAYARTKSEARAKFKEFWGVRRLPLGVTVVALDESPDDEEGN